jgi:hypothetical protein
MAVIENCRTAALGGHVDACEDCGHLTPQHRCSECPRMHLSPGSPRSCRVSAAAGSKSAIRRATNLTHQAAPNGRTEPAAQPPQPRKTRNPHRPSPQPRGFLLGRFSDARWHPETFTVTVIPGSSVGSRNLPFVRTPSPGCDARAPSLGAAQEKDLKSPGSRDRARSFPNARTVRRA